MHVKKVNYLLPSQIKTQKNIANSVAVRRETGRILSCLDITRREIRTRLSLVHLISFFRREMLFLCNILCSSNWFSFSLRLCRNLHIGILNIPKNM